MGEINRTLHGLGFEQLLLAFMFLAAYALALSGLTGARGRSRAALLVLLAAIGFVARTDPWVHGALLLAFAVVGMGVFIVAVELASRVIEPAERAGESRLDTPSIYDALAPESTARPHGTRAAPTIPAPLRHS